MQNKNRSASQVKSQFVAVDSIAAKLNTVMEVAKEISQVAANASAIAFSAGEKAKVFSPSPTLLMNWPRKR